MYNIVAPSPPIYLTYGTPATVTHSGRKRLKYMVTWQVRSQRNVLEI